MANHCNLGAITMTNFIPGIQLSTADRDHVLKHTFDRPTCDAWKVFKAWPKASGKIDPRPTDTQWLAQTMFRVDAAGSVPRDSRVQYVSMCKGISRAA